MARYVRQCNSGPKAGNFILILDLNYGSYDINTNKTYVEYFLYIAGGSYGGYGYNPYGYSFYGYPTYGTIILKNGNTGAELARASGSSSGTVSNSSAPLIAQGSAWVPHNADGTLNLYIQGSMSGGYSAYVNGGFVDGSIALPTIPRATNAPSFSVDVEKSINISLNPASNSFTHSIKLAFGSNTKWLNASGGLSSSEVKLSSKSPLFNCPKEYYNEFTGTSKQGTMTLITYSGNTKIGEKTNLFTIYANSTICKPVLTGTMVDSNETTKALTGNENKIIKGYSNGLITFTEKRASSVNDSKATIKSMTIDSNSIDTDLNEYTKEKLADTKVTVKITNSRGFSGTYEIKTSGDLINYIPVTFNGNFFRPQPTTGEVELESNGNYFNNTFGAVENALILNLYYREKNTDEWLPLEINTPTIENNTYKLNQSLGTIFNYQRQFEFRMLASDKLSSIENITLVSEGIPIFWWDSNKIQFEKDVFFKNLSLLDTIYPIGSIFISTNNTNPSSFLGGKWEVFGSGKTLVGVDTSQTEFNSVEKTGGSKYLQRHHHEGLTFWNKSVSLDAGTKDGYNLSYGNTIISGRENAFFTNEAGEGDSGNLQPYITVYMWKRVE